MIGNQTRCVLLLPLALIATWEWTHCCDAADLRRPTAMGWLDEERLCVANKTGESIAIIKHSTHELIELPIDVSRNGSGASFTDMAVIDDSHVIVLDASAHELLVVRIEENDACVVGRLRVGHSPANVVVADQRAYVSCLWSRRTAVVDLEDLQKPRLMGCVDLAFSPRQQLILDQGSLFVADAFGGHWAVIQLDELKVHRTGHFHGSHNISGLTLDATGENLLIPHMTLNSEKPTTGFNVHWGDIMLNVVRRVSVDELLAGQRITDHFYYLGRPDIAAGDPTGIVLTQGGRQLVCFAGTSELGISDVGANSFDRVKVGCRPVAVVVGPRETFAYVANQLDDTVSVIDVNRTRLVDTIKLNVEHVPASVELGERLFFDSTLSSDGWFSCHSCHTEGHTNGGLADTFGDGFTGDAKRVPSLLDAGRTGPWSWNGEIDDLGEQVRQSVQTTMRGAAISDERVKAIVAYVHSLSAPPSVTVARGEFDSERAARGQQVFANAGCRECHVPGSFTSSGSYPVEFRDDSGRYEFNPPSLRAVSHRYRLLHDNRAESVRQVLSDLRHQAAGDMSEDEFADLVYYVESL